MQNVLIRINRKWSKFIIFMVFSECIIHPFESLLPSDTVIHSERINCKYAFIGSSLADDIKPVNGIAVAVYKGAWSLKCKKKA